LRHMKRSRTKHLLIPKAPKAKISILRYFILESEPNLSGLDLLPDQPARLQGTAFPMVAISIYPKIIEATVIVHIRGEVEIETKLKSESNTETLVCHCLDVSRVSAAFVVASFWLMVLCPGIAIGHDAHVGEIVRGHSDRPVNTE
jgi:hypothetical protein